jgi:hypothetical protein
MGGRACARVDSVPVTLLSPAIARWRQIVAPEKLQVLAWYPTRREAETALHAALAGYRLHGEWFESEPVKIALEDGSLASICSDLKGSDCD